MSEGFAVKPQHLFLQARELRQTEGEPAIVAEITKIAEMIGDALALQTQRAQPYRAWRCSERCDLLHRLRVRPGVGHGAVAGYAAGEPVCFGDAEGLEALFDALVYVAQSLLQPQHLLADDLEAEVPGLDDPRVDGADRNLVHAVAGNFDEWVILLARLPLGRGLEIATQGKLIDRPGGSPRPRPLIVGVAVHADQVEGRALHAVGHGEDQRQVGVTRAFVGQRVFQQGETIVVAQQHAHAKAALAIPIVACPQSDQLTALLPGEAARRQQLARADRATLRWDWRRQRRGRDTERRDI